MHQTDSLFHKKAGSMGFTFGFDVDNHAINTCPKETMVRISFAEAGGLGGQGPWSGATTGTSPGAESDLMRKYLSGGLTTVGGSGGG